MKKQRHDGYYWVKSGITGEWKIAMWNSRTSDWYLFEKPVDNWLVEIEEVDEERLKRKQNPK